MSPSWCEKAQHLTYNFKKMKTGQIFVALSEYLNFMIICLYYRSLGRFTQKMFVFWRIQGKKNFFRDLLTVVTNFQNQKKFTDGLKSRKIESISFRTLIPILRPNPSYVILDKSWVTVAEVEVQTTKEAFENRILMLNALGAIHILRN